MKTEKTFFQELLNHVFSIIEQVVQKESITLEIYRRHLKISSDSGLMKLSPCIVVSVGDVHLDLWKKSSTRTLSMPHFEEALSEIMYEEVYSDLVHFMVTTNIKERIRELSNQASVMDCDSNLGLIRAKGREKEKGKVSDDFINGTIGEKK